MVNRNKVILLISGGMILAAVYFFVFNEVRRVKRRVENAAALLNKAPDEQKLTLAAKSNKLKSYLGEKLAVDIPAYRFRGTYGREDVATRVLAGFLRSAHIHVKLYDLDAKILSDGRAEAVFTAEIDWQVSGRESGRDFIELACRLEKVSDRWVFTQVDVVETLEK